ncbi:MAG: methylmalonyl Co-A mutase-associated GTPase MeaB [Defluviitaleaceae bacterium]|nr:methylmalonyl Co-A mutase-associated GTPase MeaB [Defluviitaleaceae bacterium]
MENNNNPASALRVVPGVESTEPYGSYQVLTKSMKASQNTPLNAEAYVEGILAGDRGILSRAITIIESGASKHFELGQQIVSLILPYTGKSVRIGITGVPGAGKSTTIEALGLYLLDMGKKAAVLAVDPTSALSKGSILGDKTRMINLSRRPEAFIRPSPSGGALGGVTRKSRETILLCEAAGFDSIIVETVGVGQSEVEVRSMVDFFLFLAITGAGDELQGIKKGIIEMADGVFINKADGDNKSKAVTTCAEYNQILHYLRQATEGWETKAHTVSALTGEGIGNMWQVISDFVENTKASGMLNKRRARQTVSWVRRTAEDYVRGQIFGNPLIIEALKEREDMLIEGNLSPAKAAKEIMEKIDDFLIKQ